MNKKCYFLVLIFFIGFNSYASQLKNPYIYEVKKDDQISYVFGSLHLGFSVSDLTSWVNELHKRAKIHSYEIDFGAGESLEDYKFAQELFLNPDSEYVKNYISKMEKEGLPLASHEIERLVEIGFPRFLAQNMTDKAECTFLVFYDQIFLKAYRSLDHDFANRSLLMGKKTVPLENEEIREAADQLVGGSEECLIKDLIWEEDVLTMVRDIQAEDGLFEHYLDGFESTQYPDKTELDLFYRNKQWIPVLKKMFDEGDAFVVFGVGHLFGEEGIISLLKKEGYRVQRVSKNPLEGSEAIPPAFRPYR